VAIDVSSRTVQMIPSFVVVNKVDRSSATILYVVRQTDGQNVSRNAAVCYTVSQKKLDPFSFEHNFGNYCSVLIILSLLQTEINYDQMYTLKSATISQICK